MFKKTIFTVVMFSLFIQSAYSDFPAPYNKLTDLTFNELIAFDLPDNNTMFVKFNPDKPKSLYPFEFLVTFVNSNQIISAEVDLNMSMNMGEFHYKLAFQNNQYNKTITLPRCSSGRKKWYAKITVNLLDNSKEERYLFFDLD